MGGLLPEALHFFSVCQRFVTHRAAGAAGETMSNMFQVKDRVIFFIKRWQESLSIERLIRLGKSVQRLHQIQSDIYSMGTSRVFLLDVQGSHASWKTCKMREKKVKCPGKGFLLPLILSAL